jgi:hypothetical protein
MRQLFLFNSKFKEKKFFLGQTEKEYFKFIHSLIFSNESLRRAKHSTVRLRSDLS